MFKRFAILATTLLAFSGNLQAQPLANPVTNYAELFKYYNACFLLYSVKEQKIVSEYNPNNRCKEQLAPDSTFKVALALMAFDKGLIKKDTVFKWDGINREIDAWNQDQTAATWFKYSALWVSQKLTPVLGQPTIKHYLAAFHYGNQDFSGDSGQNNGLQYAWLSSSLKISAYEQLAFLKALLNNKLGISPEATDLTKALMYQGKLANGADYYGKSGSGRNGRNERLSNPSKLRDGWFIGFIEDKGQEYIFVSNLTDKTPVSKHPDYGKTALLPYGSAVLKPITLEILNDHFAV